MSCCGRCFALALPCDVVDTGIILSFELVSLVVFNNLNPMH